MQQLHQGYGGRRKRKDHDGGQEGKKMLEQYDVEEDVERIITCVLFKQVRNTDHINLLYRIKLGEQSFMLQTNMIRLYKHSSVAAWED